MKKLFVILTIVVLALFVSPVEGQDTPVEVCQGGEWYDTFLLIQGGVGANIPNPEDDQETLANKTITLYAYSFVLEAMEQAVPECAKTLIRKYAVLTGTYADFGMLVVLQSGDLGLSEEAFAYLLEQYANFILRGETSVDKAYLDLNLEGTMQ